jgi:hypothetical protein
VAFEFELSDDVTEIVCNLGNNLYPNFGNANHIGYTDGSPIPNSINLHGAAKPLLTSQPSTLLVYVAAWAGANPVSAVNGVAANVSCRRTR